MGILAASKALIATKSDETIRVGNESVMVNDDILLADSSVVDANAVLSNL